MTPDQQPDPLAVYFCTNLVGTLTGGLQRATRPGFRRPRSRRLGHGQRSSQDLGADLVELGDAEEPGGGGQHHQAQRDLPAEDERLDQEAALRRELLDHALDHADRRAHGRRREGDPREAVREAAGVDAPEQPDPLAVYFCTNLVGTLTGGLQRATRPGFRRPRSRRFSSCSPSPRRPPARSPQAA